MDHGPNPVVPPSPTLSSSGSDLTFEDDGTLCSDYEARCYSPSNASTESFPSIHTYDRIPPFRLHKDEAQDKVVYEAWNVYLAPDVKEATGGSKICGINVKQHYRSYPSVPRWTSETYSQSELAEMHAAAQAKHDATHKRGWASRLIRGNAAVYEDVLESRVHSLPEGVQSEINRLLADRETATSSRLHNRSWTIAVLREQLHFHFTKPDPEVIEREHNHKLRFWKNGKLPKGTRDRDVEYFIVIRGTEKKRYGAVEDTLTGSRSFYRHENPWEYVDTQEIRRINRRMEMKRNLSAPRRRAPYRSRPRARPRPRARVERERSRSPYRIYNHGRRAHPFLPLPRRYPAAPLTPPPPPPPFPPAPYRAPSFPPPPAVPTPPASFGPPFPAPPVPYGSSFDNPFTPVGRFARPYMAPPPPPPPPMNDPWGPNYDPYGYRAPQPGQFGSTYPHPPAPHFYGPYPSVRPNCIVPTITPTFYPPPPPPSEPEDESRSPIDLFASVNDPLFSAPRPVPFPEPPPVTVVVNSAPAAPAPAPAPAPALAPTPVPAPPSYRPMNTATSARPLSWMTSQPNNATAQQTMLGGNLGCMRARVSEDNDDKWADTDIESVAGDEDASGDKGQL